MRALLRGDSKWSIKTGESFDIVLLFYEVVMHSQVISGCVQAAQFHRMVNTVF